MPQPQTTELKFVVTNTLIVRDVQRPVAFYRDVLGAKVLREGQPTFLRLDNIWLTINRVRTILLSANYRMLSLLIITTMQLRVWSRRSAGTFRRSSKDTGEPSESSSIAVSSEKSAASWREHRFFTKLRAHPPFLRREIREENHRPL